MAKEVILTGLRSNSEFHLGNYLGAIKPMVRMQHDLRGQYQLNMFVPDLHSFTTPIDHGKLYQQTIDNVRLYVAAGLDIGNEDTFVYRQSHIPAHSEMTWILSCFTYMGELSRMTQFKDKSGDNNDTVSAGLFNYPILMAADILLYGAKWIPVGEDQRQHIELTRDLAIRLNNKFASELFIVPYEWDKQLEFVGLGRGVRIRSLRNPEKKMSKSVEDPAGTIMLSDDPNEAAQKIMSATTDSMGMVKYDWETQPGVANLLQILALATDKNQDEVNQEWEGRESYGDLKKAVADAVSALLSSLQEKLAAVMAEQVEAKLSADEQRMGNIANERLLIVQKAVGLKR